MKLLRWNWGFSLAIVWVVFWFGYVVADTEFVNAQARAHRAAVSQGLIEDRNAPEAADREAQTVIGFVVFLAAGLLVNEIRAKRA